MNNITQVAVGVDSHKGKFDLSCMTHTTSEIGFVQPTYSKVFVPKSKVSIQTRTGSRLSSLFVPTMGQIDIRHYHVFVPFSTVWGQYKDMMMMTPYTLPDGETFIPERAPSFILANLFFSLFDFTNPDYNEEFAKQLACTIYRCSTLDENVIDKPLTSSEIATLSSGEGLTNLFNGSNSKSYLPKYLKGVDTDGTVHYYELNIDSERHITAIEVQNFVDTSEEIDKAWNSLSYPSFEHCDFCYSSEYVNSGGSTSHAVICFNFNGALKRLRTIFIGLGYSFNPWDTVDVTPFKLLGYYKAYWHLFAVAREYNFKNTYCYKLIKYLSDHIITDMTPNDTAEVWSLFLNFVTRELAECRYICPADYYSVSDTTTQRGAAIGEDSIYINSPLIGVENGTVGPIDVGASASRDDAVSVSLGSNSEYQSQYPLAQQLANRLLRFVNSRSVIGKQVDKLWRALFGVSPFVEVLEGGIDEVGKSSTPIVIDAIYNQTDSGDLPLGSYAGMGVSTKNGAVSKKFTFETKEHGFLVTLTAVVPKMGYFQGMLHENSDGIDGPNDFYNPKFDAMGWQAVRYNELIADRQFELPQTETPSTQLGVFGYIPRYSHLKLSCKNIVNGDISIPSRQESMLPYTLDRFFPQRSFTGIGKSFVVDALPVNEPNSFRAGTQGRTNRIFSDASATDDHVIMQIFFDIKMYAPMKPMSTSFDTIDEDSTHTIEVDHE